MKTIRTFGLGVVLAVLAPLAAWAAAPKAAVEPMLAVLEAPVGTELGEILSGRALVGFTPLLTPAAPLRLQPELATWVRLRAELPARADGEWVIRLEPAPFAQIHLYLPYASRRIQAEAGFFQPHTPGGGLRLPLPAGKEGPAEFYLELQGDVRAGLVPKLMTAAAADAADQAALRWLHYSLAGLGLVVVLGTLRFVQRPSSGAGSVVLAALAVALGGLALLGALPLLPGGTRLLALGTMGYWALLLLPCGPLLLATATYCGLPYSLPRLVPIVRGAGLVLTVLALLVLVLREDLGSLVQILVWLVWPLLAVASVVVLLLDSRSYRWAPIVCWLALGVALWLRASIELALVQASPLTLHGWLPVLVLMLAGMLAFPWIRSALQQRQMQKRKVVHEPSMLERIQQARTELMASLQAGLDNAAERDVQWIAFRRLLTGLKPVLPQLSSAVVAMNYHEEDLLQVEPRDAEPRYRTLLEQRSSLLRGLSRSRGAQQIALDFDGPEGPLPQVQLAVIPLPIEKPGWGVLLVERVANLSYGDDELELCTEFASLATTASEEAALTVRAKREAEIDPDTGVFRAALIQEQLQTQITEAQSRNRPVTVLRVEVDGIEEWLERDVEAANEALRQIAAVLRDELEFGESLGRLGPATYLMVLHGRNANVCRPVADRIMTGVTKLGLPPEVLPCIGISELRRGESTGSAVVDRAGQAAIAARRAGTPTSA